MGAYDNIQRCSIGPASFQLTDWSAKSDPILKDGMLVGRTITLDGEGFIDGSDAQDFADKVKSALPAFELSGQSIQIYGLGGKMEYELPAGQCAMGGPHISVSIERQGGGCALHKPIKFKATATIGGTEGGMPGAGTQTISKAQGPDGLLVVQISGQVVGATARELFLATILPGILADYPADGWTVKYNSSGDATGGALSYTIQAEQTLLPAKLASQGISMAAASGSRIVDGTAAFSQVTDEQGRNHNRWTYDLQIVGNPWDIWALIRPKVTIIREESEYSYGKGLALRASFEELSCPQGLLEWSCSFESQQEEAVVEPMRIQGVKTLLIYKGSDENTYTITISGRAVGLGAYPDPPSRADLPPAFFHSEPPVIGHTPLDAVQFETRWRYTLVGYKSPGRDVQAALRRLIARPQDPTFTKP